MSICHCWPCKTSQKIVNNLQLIQSDWLAYSSSVGWCPGHAERAEQLADADWPTWWAPQHHSTRPCSRAGGHRQLFACRCPVGALKSAISHLQFVEWTVTELMEGNRLRRPLYKPYGSRNRLMSTANSVESIRWLLTLCNTYRSRFVFPSQWVSLLSQQIRNQKTSPTKIKEISHPHGSLVSLSHCFNFLTPNPLLMV